jgi:hypothetical protein
MATIFKNKLVSEVGVSEENVFTSELGVRTTILGMSLTNLTGSIILASVRLEDAVENTSAFYIKEVIVPPNQSLRVINGGERLVLGPSTEILISSNIDDSLDVIVSYVEIS